MLLGPLGTVSLPWVHMHWPQVITGGVNQKPYPKPMNIKPSKPQNPYCRARGRDDDAPGDAGSVEQ